MRKKLLRTCVLLAVLISNNVQPALGGPYSTALLEEVAAGFPITRCHEGMTPGSTWEVPMTQSVEDGYADTRFGRAPVYRNKQVMVTVRTYPGPTLTCRTCSRFWMGTPCVTFDNPDDESMCPNIICSEPFLGSPCERTWTTGDIDNLEGNPKLVALLRSHLGSGPQNSWTKMLSAMWMEALRRDNWKMQIDERRMLRSHTARQSVLYKLFGELAL